MTETKELKKKNGKLKITLIIVISVLVVLGAAFAVLTLQKPYSISVGNKDVVFVKSKAAAEGTIKQIMKDYTPKDSKVKSISLDKNMEMNKQMIWEDGDKAKALSKKEAVEYIEKQNQTDKPFFTATVVGKTKGEETYTPPTEYKKDEEMFAGMEVEEVAAAEGQQYVTRQITMVNGIETENKIVKAKILKEGTARVLRRGMLGLPEGEDWKTFTGDPVFQGADELVAISKKYQGVPYKYGGRSLTSGVDCVQYVRAIFAKYGISIPDHHSGIRGSGASVSYSNMKAGDVICYSKHVAIYIGDGKIIHSTSGAGVHISPVYKGQKIVTIRRIIK